MKQLVAFLSSVVISTTAFASAFSPGDLVVVQDGTGSGALAASGTAAFLNEYSTAGGASVQQLPLPTTAVGANAACVLSGTATSEGFLTLSANGQYLTMGGYNAAVGAASITTSIGNRTVARVDLLGNIDTSTVLNDATSIGNIRSVVSDNGANVWVASSSGGMRYTTVGGTAASVQLSTTLNTSAPANVRVANIFSGQLYHSAASGAFQGVSTYGSGLPTTAGQTSALLPGFPTATGPSSYDYLFADANTLYVADDRAPTSSGGLQKWEFNGSTWVLAYTLTSGITTGLRGLTGVADGSGNEILYATTAEASANKLVTITDLLSATALPSETFTTLETASANTAFRGVELLPNVPEPSCLALAGLGLLVMAASRRVSR